MTICENEYDKKIGGYTPIPWLISGDQKWNQDHSRKTFLFSLTNNDKLNHRENDVYSVCNYPNNIGPSFGGGHDFAISDKAKTNKGSYANIGSTYYNEKSQNNKNYRK